MPHPPSPIHSRSALLALLLLPLACAASAPPPPAGDPTERSERALRAALIEEMRGGEATAPLVHAVAASYWRSGELDSSRIFLERAVLLDAGYVPSLTWLSRLYYEAGEIERGIALLDPVVMVEPDPDPELMVNLAVLRLAAGEIHEAEALLAAASDAHPDNCAAPGNLGYLYLQLGELTAAEARLATAIACDESAPEFHNNLGIVYRERRQYELAVREFERAVVLDPGFAEAHHNLAVVYKLNLFDDALAREHFRRFLALGGSPEREVAALFRRDEPIP